MSLCSRSSSDTLSGRPEARSAAIPSALSGLILASTPTGVPSAERERCRQTAETIADFVDAMAEIRAPATVRRYVASIAIVHRVVGFGKTVSSPLIRLAVQRMHRRKGRRQGQVQGLTSPLRQRLLEAAGDRLIDVRNRALLAVAYDAMLRRAELTSLQIADLVEEMRGDATLLVRNAARPMAKAAARSSTSRATPSPCCARGSIAAEFRTDGCSARSARAGTSASGSTRVRSRASSRRWRGAPI